MPYPYYKYGKGDKGGGAGGPPAVPSEDEGVPSGPDAATSAVDAAADEPLLTDIATGADPLLSTIFGNDVSELFSAAEGGWATGPQDGYSAAGAAEGSLGDFAGRDVDPYSNMPPEGANANAYTTVQNINPSTGGPNADPFADSTQSPPATSSGWAGWGLSGPPPSILSSQDLLAENTYTFVNNNITSDAGGGDRLGPAASVTEDSAPNTLNSTMGQLVDKTDQSAGDASGVINQGLPDQRGFSISPPSPPDPAQPPPSPPVAQSTAAPAASLPPSAPPSAAPLVAPPTPPPDPPPVPPDQSQTQQTSPPGSPTQETISQQQEADWRAGYHGMWDSAVNTAVSLLFIGANPLARPQLDWAKFGPPAPTGDPARDADLLDNYQRGGLFTTTISLAAPFAAEGLFSSALSASTKLPALEGIGMGGGGRLIDATEQWLSAFGETEESLGPELPTLGPAPSSVDTGIARVAAENPNLLPELDNAVLTEELGGPGEVRDDFSVNNMTREAAAYQEKAGGLPTGKGYYLNGPGGIPVQFDGYADNKLIEAKYYLDDGSFMRGANEFMNNPNSEFAQEWYGRAISDLKQAESQVAAAGNFQVEWRVAGEQAAELLQQMFNTRNLPINVIPFF